MAKLTKGTQLYFVDPADDSLMEVEAITSFNPGGMPADQIEVTTLTDEAKQYMRGMRTPGQASVEINADPTNESHVRLHELAQDDSVESMHWIIGWSDGDEVPTIDTNGEFETVSGRSWIQFDGYVSDFPFDFSLNTVVKSTVTIQRTGTAVFTPSQS